MADVLRDNLGLAKQLAGVTNPFHRWDKVERPELMG
jgi:hypothetical protein